MRDNATYQALKRREEARAADRAVDQVVETDRPYRDLQAIAKKRDIPANQSREDLEAAIADASADAKADKADETPA